MTNKEISQLWRKVWNTFTYQEAWGKVFADLTFQDAAWKPQPNRHSIWQIVNHIIFWREYTIKDYAGQTPSKEETVRRNWQEPAVINKDAWEVTKRQFAKSQQEIATTYARVNDPENSILHLVHDSYHIGQIMYLRALKGLPPLEMLEDWIDELS